MSNLRYEEESELKKKRRMQEEEEERLRQRRMEERLTKTQALKGCCLFSSLLKLTFFSRFTKKDKA